MKYYFYILFLCTSLFGANAYFSFDIQNHYDIHSDFLDVDMDDSFDKGSIAFGINQTIHRNEQFGIALGCMFTFDAFENDMANQELDLYSLYVRPYFVLSDKTSLWASIGNATTESTESSFQPGLTYGVGIQIKRTEHLSIGFSYNVYNASMNMAEYNDGLHNFDSATIEFKLKKLSADLIYSF